MYSKRPDPTILYCVNAGIVPKQPHFAIVAFQTITVPSRYIDEDTETHTISQYTAYLERDEWEDEIRRRMTSADAHERNFVPFQSTPAAVSVQVDVHVKIT